MNNKKQTVKKKKLTLKVQPILFWSFLLQQDPDKQMLCKVLLNKHQLWFCRMHLDQSWYHQLQWLESFLKWENHKKKKLFEGIIEIKSNYIP